METVLSIRNVVKTFGPVRAVDGLSFDVRSGTITGLLGRNGAGKRTTLRMITGVFLPDAGSISLLGSTNGASRARDRVGYLPEERGLYRKMKVLEQLLFFAEIKNRPPAQVRPRAEEWLRRFDLLSAATVYGLFWLTAIFRVGILSYGKRPTIPELWRWLKAA